LARNIIFISIVVPLFAVSVEMAEPKLHWYNERCALKSTEVLLPDEKRQILIANEETTTLLQKVYRCIH
jgi:hypothetical protein